MEFKPNPKQKELWPQFKILLVEQAWEPGSQLQDFRQIEDWEWGGPLWVLAYTSGGRSLWYDTISGAFAAILDGKVTYLGTVKGRYFEHQELMVVIQDYFDPDVVEEEPETWFAIYKLDEHYPNLNLNNGDVE